MSVTARTARVTPDTVGVWAEDSLYPGTLFFELTGTHRIKFVFDSGEIEVKADFRRGQVNVTTPTDLLVLGTSA